MPYTNCKAHMEFVDTTAVEDSAASSQSNADMGHLELLKQEESYPSYAIPDFNSFLLDGNRKILSRDSSLPFISCGVSDGECVFTDTPKVEVIFKSPHTSAGITLKFADDYPVEIRITWYDLSGPKLIGKTFYPDRLNFFCRNQVDNYGKVTVEFTKSRLPGQRVKLTYIKYGVELDWGGDNLQSASVTEEVDITSAVIPINKAEISIIDESDDFEISNHNGIWKSIQKRQCISIMEETENKEVPCGRFYIETWKSEKNIISFSLIDMIGLLDKTKFYGGEIYNGCPAGEIISAIMKSAGVEDYTVAGNVWEVLLSGHIPICTHREALQQVAFACGAIVDCGRQGGINIYIPDRKIKSIIGTGRKFMGTSVELDAYVSGVSITYTVYSPAQEDSEIYNDTLPEGISLIEFSEPYMLSGIRTTAGTILEAGTNFIKVLMATTGACTISGRKYESKKLTYTEKVDIIEAGETENVVSFEGCTLFNSEQVKKIAGQLLDYYQMRKVVKIRYLIVEEKTGDWENIMDTRGGMAITQITQQTIDLTGGFIATATCRGYSKVNTQYDYTGEFYAGERGAV
ncbi:MAG: hypothetical protein NC123_16795 [Butyrivibrio sp.]|nr:hypothetical protein [Acetatifactor muris]MCM1561176.1 hypothetical protein [Butyrivibrio sp.]